MRWNEIQAGNAVHLLLGLLFIVAGCGPVAPMQASLGPPARYDGSATEPVRTRTLLEGNRVIVERANGVRYLLELGIGCLQSLPDSIEQPSIRVVVASESGFAGPGSQLVFPDRGQGCWIERSTRLARDP